MGVILNSRHKGPLLTHFCLQPRRVLLDILLEPDPGVGPGAGHPARGAAGSGRPGLPHRPAQPPGVAGQAG